MKRLLILLTLLPAPHLAAQSKLTFPPDRLPLPAVGPTKLAPDVLYVVQNADEKLTYLLLTSPDAGILSVTEKSGTVNIFAKFHDSDGQLVWREYTGKQIWIVQAKAKGECELLFVPSGTPTAKDVVRKTLSVEMGQGPQPPPKPASPVKHLTFVYDLTPASQKVVNDAVLRAWLKLNEVAVSALPGGDPVLTQRGLGPAITLAGGPPCIVLQDAAGNVLHQFRMPLDPMQVRPEVERFLK